MRRAHGAAEGGERGTAHRLDDSCHRGRGSDFCWPCGACRQMLYEFAPGLRVLAARGDGAFETATLDQLMPHGFGPLSLK